MGQPISASRKRGLQTWLCGKEPFPGVKRIRSGREEARARPIPIRYKAVHALAAVPIPAWYLPSAKVSFPSFKNMSGQLPDCDTVGVGQKEEPTPVVGSAHFRRAEEARFHAVTHCPKVGVHGVESEADVSGHVFGEQEGGFGFGQDTPHVGPQMPLVGASAPSAGHAEGLARPARSDDIHDSTPAAAVESGNIGPHRRVIQGRFLHPDHESGRGVSVSFDPTDSAISR